MKYQSTTSSLLLLTLLSALKVHSSPIVSSSPHCKDFKIPISISTSNLAFGLPKFTTNFDVANFIDTISSRNASTAATVVAGNRQNVSATYFISGTFCQPRSPHSTRGITDEEGQGETVLIATHGLNFDKSYWDPEIEKEKYSFVNFAVNQGYSILFYDRLGVGMSQRVSGYIPQLGNQVAILEELIKLVKEGKFIETPQRKKVVLVGHSFGSAISLNLVAQDPDLVDGVVLTGFSLNATANNLLGFVEGVAPRIASQQNGKRWGGLDTGYLTPVDIYSNVASFFKAPDYSQAVAEYADATKAPFAVTELLADSHVVAPPYAFKGAVMILTGQYDYIFCTSDCDGGVLEVPAKQYFKNARAFKASSYPGAGHGLNFHLNAAGSFKEITDFLGKNGL